MSRIKKKVLFYGGCFLSGLSLAFVLATGIKAVILIWCLP